MSAPCPKSFGEPEPAGVRRARLAGRIMQSLALAALLFLAIYYLLMSGEAVAFRYQGF
ncbi:MAG: hypothetical protein JWM68_781 [Verrucomicrobiales bacterium]|nr:hypothetical protein [Verrucomicrobiales bacterium]